MHCFVSAPPKISVTQIVKYLKGISGNTLFKEYPDLRKYLWKGQLWNGSYFCETIGSTSEENILKYIERQKNCQLDNLHKISTKIANSYDVVCVESLDMKVMSNHGFGNGKATLDNGYGMFLSMLHPEMKNLAIRKMTCDCGLTISRDQNAAINILREGLRLLTEVA